MEGSTETPISASTPTPADATAPPPPPPAPAPPHAPPPPAPPTTAATPTAATPTNTIVTTTTTTPLKKLGFKQVDKTITDAYVKLEVNHSTICDILAIYLKGQKILYTEAKTVCEQRLNFLMLPAIFITAMCTILSLVLRDYEQGATIVSSLNGLNAFILALISYLKLDAKAEAHRTSAYKFDKLQSYLEFNSGKMLFDSEAASKLREIIQETENNVREIKETNQFILPEKIRFRYPRLYNMNVFAEVKRIQNLETIYVNRMKDALNEILEIRSKYAGTATAPTPEDLLEIRKFETNQKELTETILTLRDDYLNIDDIFENELEKERNRLMSRIQCCGWLKT